MAKNALIICNFRLRNIEEFNEILSKFKGSKYDIFDIGEIDRENFKIEILEQKIEQINKNNNGYENISVISNIRDVIFIWYRAYNKLIDNFIFFMDKVNYNLLKRVDNSEVLEEIAEFRGVYQEDLKGKIHINIDYNNYEQIFEFLFKDFKFRYFNSLENIEYFNKNRNKESKKNIKKNYTLKDKKISFGNSIQEENIELSVEIEEEKSIFFDLIDNSKYFYPFYSLFIIKNYSGNEAREILLKCFEKYEKADENTKEEIADLILNTKGFEKLNFKEKIGLLSINFGMDIKKSQYITMPVLKEIIEDNGENAQTYYQIFNNLNLKNLSNNGKDYYKLSKKAMDIADKYYERLMMLDLKYNKESKKIMFIVDSLETKSYSGTKLIFDIVDNIIENYSEVEIMIYSEENFFGIQEENPVIMDYNNRILCFSDKDKIAERRYNNSKVKVLYSDIYNKKEDRIKKLVKTVIEYEPEVIFTTTIYSNSINTLYKYVPIINISLGGINYVNNFDLTFYPHIKSIIQMLPNFGIEYNEEKMVGFDYTGVFERALKAEDRSKFLFSGDDFILITVGVRLAADIKEGFADMIIEFIKTKKNVKWLIVGETDISVIDKKYKELIGKSITKVKYISNLAEVYQMCDIYINPQRLGGGFSMAEAITNDLCVLTPAVSPAGILHCGIKNSAFTPEDFKKELYKLYEEQNYRKLKLNEERKVQESLSYKNTIPKLMNYIEKAKELYLERKGVR